MNQFILVFEFMDGSVFKTINHLRNHLDIVCRGKYELNVDFNKKENHLAHKYNLKGAPALINTQNNKVVYGNSIEREELKEIL